MTIALKRIAAVFLALPIAAVLVPAAHAGPKDTDAKIQALQQQLESLQAQIADIKRSQSDQYADAKKQVEEVQNQVAETAKQQKPDVKVSITNGRPTISSTDGNFTAAIRANIQSDWGYYMQSAAAKTLPAAYGPDLSSGTNMRRLQFGIQGKVFGDWSYNFNYDFGGSGNEAAGHILLAYLQYDGLAPWAFRVGVYAPPVNFDDSTSATDLMFLERNSASNMQRNIAGAEGRDAVSIIYAGDRLFGALSYSGGKLQDTAVTFDEQQALVGRISDLVYKDEDTSILIGANFTHVFKLPDAVANGGATLATTPGAVALGSVTLSDFPEITVDSNAIKLVSTGPLAANHVTSFGLEAAGVWKNFYAQAGYFGYEVDRAAVAYKTYTAASTFATTVVHPDNNDFSAWYVAGSWIITGERKAYVPATGAYTSPKPAEPFSLSKGTWGAWEIVARYSDLDLNSHINSSSSVITNWSGTTKTYTFYNTVRGGDQKIVALGLNWYPNNAVRFLLDYQYVQIDRLQAPGTNITAALPAAVKGGQDFQTIALRAQLAL